MQLVKTEDQQNKYEFNTQFSLVGTTEGATIAPHVGGSGFVILKAKESLAGNVTVKAGASICQLAADEQCALVIPPHNAVLLDYDITNIPVNAMLEANQTAVVVNKRGGVVRLIDSHTLYYAQGRILDTNRRPIDLLIGEITDKQGGNRQAAFTDEKGEFVLKMLAGDYLLYIKDYQPTDFSVSKEDLANDMVNIGDIILMPLEEIPSK